MWLLRWEEKAREMKNFQTGKSIFDEGEKERKKKGTRAKRS
jgi:hypothetical protein